MSFNPSPGLNVFQTSPTNRLEHVFKTFQSLTWVERLSDLAVPSTILEELKGFNPSPGLNVFQTVGKPKGLRHHMEFQSLTWVERLSDRCAGGAAQGEQVFQSLTWVERLSDRRNSCWPMAVGRCFNPSPGLNVFQTVTSCQHIVNRELFQSLTWVERLSDPGAMTAGTVIAAVSIPHLG